MHCWALKIAIDKFCLIIALLLVGYCSKDSIKSNIKELFTNERRELINKNFSETNEYSNYLDSKLSCLAKIVLIMANKGSLSNKEKKIILDLIILDKGRGPGSAPIHRDISSASYREKNLKQNDPNITTKDKIKEICAHLESLKNMP